MVRFTLILIVLLVVAIGGYFIAQNPLPLSFQTLGYTIETSLGFAALIALLASFILFVFWKLVDFLIRLPKIIQRNHKRTQQKKGLICLETIMINLAEGQIRKAYKESQNLSKYFKENPVLSHLLKAKIARLNQEIDLARKENEALLAKPRTQIVARKELAEIEFDLNQIEQAERHAEKAYESDPGSIWAFELLFETQILQEKWQKALSTLEQGVNSKHLDKMIANRRESVILTILAKSQETENQQTAKTYILRALKKSPGFAPAAILAARIFDKTGNKWKASNVLEAAWTEHPHPALAHAYQNLKQGESPDVVRKHLLKLPKLNKTHKESKILEVEQALIIENLETANKLITELLEKEKLPALRICILKSRLAFLEGKVEEANIWNEKSKNASMDPDWSDLDLEGSAFEYMMDDWKRLVFSYGDHNRLIHSRHERFQQVLKYPISSFCQDQDIKTEHTKQDDPLYEQPIDFQNPASTTDRSHTNKKNYEQVFIKKKASDNKKTSTQRLSTKRINPEERSKKSFKQPDDPGIE